MAATLPLMLDLEEAQARILDGVRTLGMERVPLDDAVGRVLARDVVAHIDLPPFDYSAMDGYAIAHGGGDLLRAVGESRAGGASPAPLAEKCAMRIFTGAPLPKGADTIVMQEETSSEGGEGGEGAHIRLTGRPRKGDHVRRAGEDLARGSIALPRGTWLRTSHLPLLGALEVARVSVIRRPIVTVLATGDELREPGDPPLAGTIAETNGPSIAALARRFGAAARLLPIARDQRGVLRDALLDAFEASDVVLTIGGVSVGDHDLVRGVLEEAGVALDFWKVAIKPGKPLAVGRRGAARFVGLPGNPASAWVTFLLFAAPLLRALSGDPQPLPRRVRARLARDVPHTPGRTELVRASLREIDGIRTATAVASQASGSVVSIARADGLIVVPRASTDLPAGAEVEVIPFGEGYST